ncbi:MAG: glucose-1-phosphate cytidylyltransferase [Parasphingorhabdus sp.]|jgi:glucose-1-phosphate cytidylyltransferase
MKCVILAGGVGSRLSEETINKPKPMVEIGGRPILWHIMSHYAKYGHNDFAIALGYKSEMIKRYMLDFSQLSNDLRVDFSNGSVEHLQQQPCDWRVDLVDTGIDTLTGGRLKRLANHLDNSTFMMTWGDGVSNIDLRRLLKFHKQHGKLATVTAVRPPARFGHINLEGDIVAEFSEKPQTREGWINGAFFVLEPQVLDYISGDDIAFEREPLEQLARDRQLMAYRHEGFWQCMDTLRDKVLLESLWQNGDAPWKVW